MSKHLVVGPPGCGKTSYVARQAKRAAQKYGDDGVAIVSLTKAAAQEIASRSAIHQDHVGTLHSMAFRALECKRGEVADSPDGLKEWNRAQPGWQLSGGRNADDILGGGADDILTAVGRLRHLMVPHENWPSHLRQFHAEWESWKERTGRLDFTDMIERAIENVPHCPGRPSVLFLDEAQDSSLLEHELLTRWQEEAEQLVTVGDPDQSIFGFRGGSPTAMVEGIDGEPIVLEQSHRVPAEVHATAVAWIEQLPDRLPVAYKPTPERGRVVHQRSLSIRDLGGVARLAQGHLDAGRSVMVLASCFYMLAPLMARLRNEGVPFANPYRPTDGRFNPMRSARRLAAFLRPDERVWGDQQRLWTWADLEAWLEPVAASGTLTPGAKALIERKATPGRFKTMEPPPDLDALRGLFCEHEWGQVIGLDVEWWWNSLLASKRKSHAYPRAVYRRDPKALVAEPRLCVGTIHSVKGGEADVVILAPDVSRTAWWGRGRAPGACRRNSEEWREMVRTFYVGMTRARQELHLLAPGYPECVRWL